MAALLPDVVAPIKLMLLTVTSVSAAVLAFEFGAAEITATSVLIAALGVVIVNIMAALATWRKSNEVKAVADVAVTKIDEVKGEVSSVKAHVDGMTTARDAKIDSLQKELEIIRTQLADEKKTAALLAQAVAQSTTPGKIVQP